MRNIVGLIVVTVLLAACAGNSNGGESTEGTSTAVEVALVSPLEDALGIPSDPGRRQYQLLTQQQTADAQIVQCMQDAGFFYTVEAVDETLRSGAYVGDGSREWTSVHGLGVTSSFLDLVQRSDRPSSDAAADNLNYVNSLTAEQATQYDLALIGEQAPDATTGAYAPAGCWGAAFNDILDQVTYIAAFDADLASLNSRLDSDPRVLAFETTWSACMNERDYRYSSQKVLVDDLYARLLQVELDSAGRPTASSQQLLDELLVYEQQVALASYDCRADFQDEIHKLRYDYEQEFLDDNRFKIGEIQNASE